MGNSVSTPRLDRLTAHGFSVTECRMALAAADGNVERAEQMLLERRRQAASGGAIASRVNAYMQDQRPWSEFFERFLWPEHWQERVQTNLVYYRANYVLVCLVIVLTSVIISPSLLLVAIIAFGGVAGAIAWGDEPVPGLNQPLSLEQRLAGASLVAAVCVNMSGHAQTMARLALACTVVVLAHASFRARSLSSRWKFFMSEQ